MRYVCVVLGTLILSIGSKAEDSRLKACTQIQSELRLVYYLSQQIDNNESLFKELLMSPEEKSRHIGLISKRDQMLQHLTMSVMPQLMTANDQARFFANRSLLMEELSKLEWTIRRAEFSQIMDSIGIRGYVGPDFLQAAVFRKISDDQLSQLLSVCKENMELLNCSRFK